MTEKPTIKELNENYIEGLREASDYTGVPFSTLSSWIKTTRINPIWVGKTQWFEKRELDLIKNDVVKISKM